MVNVRVLLFVALHIDRLSVRGREGLGKPLILCDNDQLSQVSGAKRSHG